MTQSFMPQLKGRKALEKTMVVMVLFLLVGLSQAGIPCKNDSTCRRNVCINMNCASRSVASGPCETNSHCFNTTNVCINNLCSSLSPAGGTCDANDSTDCAVASSTCSNGICLSPSGGQCSANNQCAAVSDSCIESICKVKAQAGETCDANDNADCGTPNNICDGTSCAFDLSLLRWEGNKAMNIPRTFAASIAVGDYLYVFGGQLTDSFPVLLNIVERYDPSSNVWSFKAEIPVAVWKHSVVAVGTFIYLIGGAYPDGTPLPYFFRYDTINDVWSTFQDLPLLPQGIYSVAAAAVGTTIYTFGGQTATSTSTAQTAVYSFDTAAPEQGWKILPSLITAITQASAVAVNNLIYITGGASTNTKTYLFDAAAVPLLAPQDINVALSIGRSNHASFYNPTTNKIFLVGGTSFTNRAKTVESARVDVTPLNWGIEPAASLNLISTANSGGFINSRFYIAGTTSTSASSSLLFAFDVSISRPVWVPFDPTPTPVYYMAVGKVGSIIISAGGLNHQGSPSSQTNQYNIATNVWSTLSPSLSSSQMGYAVVGSELYIFGGVDSSGIPTTATFYLKSDRTAWIRRPNGLKSARINLCGASQGTKIYAYGGSSAGSVLDTMEIFETDSGKPGYNVWTDVTSLSKTSGNSPTPVQFCAAVSTGTKILIFGGITGTTANTVTGLIQSFDIASETWDAPIQTTITPRFSLSATVLNGFAIVSGGTTDNVYSLAIVEAFNVFTGKIKTLPDMPSPRLGHGSVTDGDSVIVVGGQNGALVALVEKLKIFPIV